MAEYIASTPCVKLHLWTSCVKEKGYLIRNSHFKTPQRKYPRGSWKVLCLHSRKTYRSGLSNFKSSPFIRESALRCSCLGSLVDPDGLTASDLVSVSDQLLLITSIALTYMAGVLPLKRPNFTSWRISYDNVVGETATSSGSAKNNDDCVNIKCAWDAVKEKLLYALNAVEHKSNLGNRLLELDQENAKRPLSLYAVSEGPKLRLLWTSFKHLEDEVNNVLGDCEAFTLDDWLTIFPETIQKAFDCICMAWLGEELCLENKKLDEALFSLMIQKLKGDEVVLQTIRKSGKEDLYAELLYFLRFGFLRKSCCYDQSLFSLHGDSILEDLVITLADGVANVYLELISVDGNLSNEMNNLGMTMCNLSTRAIQRLRNEVALNQWLYQNMEAVVSMYEDRFDLCTLQSKIIEEPNLSQAENRSWWKKLTRKKSETIPASLYYVMINQFSMPVKRTKELRALTGWRYYFSLYLELSDITMPLIRAVIDKVNNAISFFLVSLIGRSLGLIYTGIRQSLRWK
ncbi:hypothetical protein JCGZ_17558 [Jatropha curcas]|uniref:DUF3685 domain-containing protein n=1 Tax=Jatropha curcas TaxID=180498 RepID=A0A067K2A5_JATCU|nr:uncharacterized protein LOC105644406 [Jatropha curcas]XP_012085128.1 uncharacterized protein LOC105644406 [Jatropha curcas]XP_020539168.1 uncharacterized protein LOC105644406 [Jatropha curcas]XP_020539169.1 uncharacterized protein LOC105644406 [Jatropha curcas]KDP26400.1 hypothetical protein JCGZ_17558 [Jatropha curcas]